jgi:hypothetical protein
VSPDDDEPPRRTPRRIQTQTDRDIAAEHKLRADLARARDVRPAHVPRDEFEDKIDTGITRRIEEDPDMHRIFRKVERRDEEAQRRYMELADWIAQVAGERPPAERIGDIEMSNATLRGRVKTMWVVMSVVGTLVLGSLGASLKLLYDAGVEKGGTTQRIEDLEREVRSNAADIRELMRHSGASSSKGGSP